MPGKAMVAIVVLALGLFVLQEVFQSDDPGVRGIIADVAFFGFVFCVLVLGIAVARGMARRYGQREDETN